MVIGVDEEEEVGEHLAAEAEIEVEEVEEAGEEIAEELEVVREGALR